MPTGDRAVEKLSASVGLRVLAILLAVAASVVVARLGGPSAKGVAATFAATATTVYAIVSLGVPEQIVQVMHAAGTDPRALLLRAWAAIVVVGLFSSLVASVVSPWAAFLVVGSVVYLVPAQAGIVALGAAGVVPQAAGAMLQPGGMIVFASLFGFDGTLTGSEAALTVALSYLCPLPVYWRFIPRRGGKPGARAALTLVRHGAKWQLPALGLRLVQRADILVVFWLLGPASAGIYSIATQLSELCFLFPRQVAAHTYHAVGLAKQVRLARALLTATLGAALTSAAVVAVAWVAITPVYGPAFEESRTLLVLLACGPVAGSGALVLHSYFRAAGRYTESGVASSGAVVVLVVGSLTLIPGLEMWGAALASSLAWAAYSALSLVTMSERWSGKWKASLDLGN